MRLSLPLLIVLLALAGCERAGGPPVQPPPRATDPIVFDQGPSTVAIDLKVDLAGLERELEAGIPRTLWRISQKDVVCVPSKKVDLKLFKIKTPKLKCDIDGTVTRGRLKFSGRGSTLTVILPLKAKVVARDIGGILKRETGTGALDLRLRLSFDLRRDWQLQSKVRIDYNWSKEPGFDFLGRRIKLTKDADKALGKLQRRIEADMERALARVKLKAAAERGWQSAHTVLMLNRDNPAVWARIAPQRFYYGGYRIAGKTMSMTLGIEGALESHIGPRPPAPEAGPLPPIEPLDIKPGSAVLKVPVVADYAVLEPVLAKALSKRAARPFELGRFGQVRARFGDIRIYGTDNGRIAVGITFWAESDIWWWRKAHGRLWLTALPVNEPNSRLVGFRDLKIAGETDMVGEGLLFAIANSDDFQTVIASALQQNFQRDFDRLKGKIDEAIAFRQDGPVAYAVTLERIETGRIKAYGQGLYLPVALHTRIKAELVKMKG